MGPTNGIIGDNFGTDLPETQAKEDDLREEVNMARFSKSTEFKKLKQYLEQRIEFYQTHLPDGRSSAEIQPGALGENWIVANSIIRELRLVIRTYESAQEAVEKKHGKN